MLKLPDFGEDVLDDEALYLCFEPHTELVQFDDGTQRSAEPAAESSNEPLYAVHRCLTYCRSR